MKPEVVAEGLQFPEGPALDREGRLYVVELHGARASRIGSDGSVEVFATTGGGPNGAAFGPDGCLYVCNTGKMPPDRRSGLIQRIAPDGELSVFTREADGEPLASPNDLAFDAAGNVYFTDPIWGRKFRDSPPAHVCFADPSGSARRLHGGLLYPNGIGISPDGRTLVVAESVTGRLHTFDIHGPGELGPPRLFAELGEGVVPDGLKFDVDGNVLCCGHETGRIFVVPPEGGEAIAQLQFEDAGITNLCFGGPENRTMFVTEARLGRVVKLDWERPGMRLFPDQEDA